MSDLINIVEESANPLSSPLWPKAIVKKLIKGYEKGKPYYLQTRGWEKLWHGVNSLPCVIGQRGQQMSIDMGFTLDGTKKKPKHQYPTSFGMDIHKLVALVMIPNSDPEKQREVDHINSRGCATTRQYACALHELFGCGEDVGKLCWLPFNLEWRSSSDNGKDSRSEDHKEFEQTVPIRSVEKHISTLSEEEKDEKTVSELERELLEWNNAYKEWLGDEADEQSYYEHLKDFIVNYRNYSKEDYRWLVDHVSQLDDDYINKLPDPIMWDVLRLENFNDELRKLPNQWGGNISMLSLIEKTQKIPDGKKGNWYACPEWTI